MMATDKGKLWNVMKSKLVNAVKRRWVGDSNKMTVISTASERKKKTREVDAFVD